MLAEGLRLYMVADEGAAATGTAAVAADGGEVSEASAEVAQAAEQGPRPPPLEGWACVGAAETGLIGPWHFARVLNARDGCEMMSEEETEPLRQERARQLAQTAAAKSAVEEAAEARKRQREAARARREAEAAAEDDDDEPEARPFNPYLAHMDADE